MYIMCVAGKPDAQDAASAKDPMTIPVLDIDPYTEAYFENPFLVHRALRDAGPVVRLSRYSVYAVARHEQVRTILMDWQSFSSARGAGLSDFKKEKPWRLPSMVLETDPPLHDRTRKVLDKVLSPAAMRRLRAGLQKQPRR